MRQPLPHFRRAVSTHAPLAGSDQAQRYHVGNGWRFNPRSPCGERPSRRPRRRISPPCFNPRSPCGERHGTRAALGECLGFNPRSPCGERLLIYPAVLALPSFNPRSPCGERRIDVPVKGRYRRVSTHAPLAGSDRPFAARPGRARCFNPRSPCGERLPLTVEL